MSMNVLRVSGLAERYGLFVFRVNEIGSDSNQRSYSFKCYKPICTTRKHVKLVAYPFDVIAVKY